MKKFKSLFVLCFVSLSLLFASCKNENTPEAVTEKFVTLIQQGKVTEAKELCDGKTKSILNMVEGMIEEGLQKAKSEGKKFEGITILSSEIDGDKAVVKYRNNGKDADSEKESSLDLKKIDDVWKVSINKEGANKEN